MGKTLDEIAEELNNAKNTTNARPAKESDIKVQLIYAFNGVGKTRLSRKFRLLIDPKKTTEEEEENSFSKIIYYNAFTEDLFYWFNDLKNDEERELRTQPNGFTDWLVTFLKDQGLDRKIKDHFQRYGSDKLTPIIESDFSKVTFFFDDGSGRPLLNVKISKGEIRTFIKDYLLFFFKLIIFFY